MVARYAGLNIDPAAFPNFASYNTSASRARAWSVGLNWYLNKNIRANVSYSRTTLGGYTGASPAVANQPENALFTRLQLAF